MSFVSKNEIEKFAFYDCVIVKRDVKEDRVSYTVEALIVKPDNSQNSNYTKSYAVIDFIGGEELSGVKDGYRKYDANDNIIEEVSDTVLDDMTLESIVKNCGDMYLCGIDRIPEKDNEYVIFLEKQSEVELIHVLLIRIRLKLSVMK